MAIIATATEIYGKSEAGSISADGGRTVTRRFHVVGSDDGGDPPSTAGANVELEVALLAIDLPLEPLGEGDDITARSFLDAGEVTLSYWGSRSFQRVDGHLNLWLLTYEYSTSPEPIGGGFSVDRSGSSRATTKGVYRTGVAPPLNPNNPSRQDIGGKKVDIGGQKTTVVFPSTSLLIKIYRETPVYASEFAGLVGRRNANGWNFFGAGSVLFVGANYSLNNSTGLWEIEYEFAIDLITAHLEQVARTGTDGAVILERTGEEGSETFSAAHVYWVQPFSLANFNFPT